MAGPLEPQIDALAGAETGHAFDHELEDVLRAETLSGESALGAARRYRGLTVSQLAGTSGLHPARIDAIESGADLSNDEISRCSQALNVPPALLAGK